MPPLWACCYEFNHLTCIKHLCLTYGLPWWLSGKDSACQARDSGSILGWEDPWRRKWKPTPVFLPGENTGHRILVVYSPWRLEELNTERVTHTQGL